MPKYTKTMPNGSPSSIASALASMLGLSASGSDISLAPLGYEYNGTPWKITITGSDGYIIPHLINPSGTDCHYDKTLGIGSGHNITIIVYKDSANDGICITMIDNMGGTGSSESHINSAEKMRCLFIGKDVSGGHYGGTGMVHIDSVLTDIGGITTFPFVDYRNLTNTTGLFHLTKMVNYLSSGYPEMKNIYVAVRRSGSDQDNVSITGQLYLDGFVYACPCSDCFYSSYSSDAKYKDVNFAYEPFVKY